MTRTPWISLIVGFGASALLASGCAPGNKKGPARFNPQTSRAEATHAALLEARADASATVLPSGAILVLGGETLQRPATDTAVSIRLEGGIVVEPVPARMPSPRAGHVAVLADGQVYLVGGRDAAGRALVSVDVYDPVNREFHTSPLTLAEPRVAPARADDPGANRVYFAGGGQGPAETLEVWSRQPFEPLGVVIGLPGGRRGRPQLALAAPGILFLAGDEGQPGAWVDIEAGTATPVEHDLLVGGSIVSSPFEEHAILVAGGRDESRQGVEGLQVVRPDQTPDAAMELTPYRFSQSTEGATVLPTPEGIYTFGGTYGKQRHPVDAVEVTGPAGHALLPPLLDATSGVLALRLEAHVILLVGGRGADGRPSRAITLLAPRDWFARLDGAVAAAHDARAFSRQVDLDLLDAIAARDVARAALDDARAQLRGAQATLAQLLADETRVDAAIGAARQTVADRTQQVAALESRLPALEATLTSLRQAAQDQSAQLRDAQSRRASLESRLDGARQALADARRAVAPPTPAPTTQIGAVSRLNALPPAPAPAPGGFQVGAVTRLNTSLPRLNTSLPRLNTSLPRLNTSLPRQFPSPTGSQLGAVTRLNPTGTRLVR